MACTNKERTGHCSHTQCPFPDVIGFDCVEVRHNETRGFCEIGLNCLAECPFSFGADFEKDAFDVFGVEAIKDEFNAS